MLFYHNGTPRKKGIQATRRRGLFTSALVKRVKARVDWLQLVSDRNEQSYNLHLFTYKIFSNINNINNYYNNTEKYLSVYSRYFSSILECSFVDCCKICNQHRFNKYILVQNYNYIFNVDVYDHWNYIGIYQTNVNGMKQKKKLQENNNKVYIKILIVSIFVLYFAQNLNQIKYSFWSIC